MTRHPAGEEAGPMTPATHATSTARLSDDDLQQVLGLARGADSVELKLTVPADHHRATIMALGIDPIDA
jgi:hypothetical protein